MADTRSKHILEAEDRTARAFKSATDKARTAATAMAKYGAAGAAAAAGGVALVINANRQSIDVLAKTSDKLGIATEKLVGLRHAAEQTAGIQGETFDKSLQTMVRSISEANAGMGEAQQSLKDLGLETAALAQMTPDQQFYAVANAMQAVENQGARVRIATKLFGEEGAALVNTLGEGEEGLRRFQAEAEAMGIALSRVDASKVEAANDSIDRAQKVAGGFAQQLTVAAAPAIEAIANELFGAAQEAGGFGNIATQAVGAVVKAVGYAGNALRGLQMLWVALKAGVNQFYAVAVNAIAAVAKKAADLANMIPGVNIQLGETLTNIGADLQARADQFKKELADLAAQPMPLEQIEEWHAGVLERAQVQAENMVSVNEQKNSALLASELAFQQKKKAADQKAVADQQQLDKRAFGTAIQGAAQHSKALFNINKGMQIAQGVMDLKGTIVSSYRYGASIGGPILGAAFAAIGGAAQAANLSALKSSSFSGAGGAGGGGGGSVPSVGSMIRREADSQPSRAADGGLARIPDIRLNIEDDALVTGKTARNLVERIVDGLKSGEFSGLQTT